MTAKQLLEETLVVTNRLMEQIAAVKKRTIVVIIVVLIAWFFRQQSVDHSEEIRNIRDSVSNMYRDFEPAMFTDLEGVKSMIAKIRKFAEEDLSKAEEIQMKTQTLESKIVTLQNFKFDQTGRADLALSSIGGRIAGIGPDTQPFYSCNFIWRSLGCPNKVNGPEKIIDPSMQPGDCFRFKSKNATVFIRLAHEAILDAVTIEHITQKISLTGDVSEAPRKFSVSVIINNNLMIVNLTDKISGNQ